MIETGCFWRKTRSIHWSSENSPNCQRKNLNLSNCQWTILSVVRPHLTSKSQTHTLSFFLFSLLQVDDRSWEHAHFCWYFELFLFAFFISSDLFNNSRIVLKKWSPKIPFKKEDMQYWQKQWSLITNNGRFRSQVSMICFVVDVCLTNESVLWSATTNTMTVCYRTFNKTQLRDSYQIHSAPVKNIAYGPLIAPSSSSPENVNNHQTNSNNNNNNTTTSQDFII